MGSSQSWCRAGSIWRLVQDQVFIQSEIVLFSQVGIVLHVNSLPVWESHFDPLSNLFVHLVLIANSQDLLHNEIRVDLRCLD